MAQICKVEAKAEIKSDPAKMYDFFKNNKSQFVNMFPQIFKSVQNIEGHEGHVGNIISLEYVLGKPMSAKVKTEEVNDGERMLRMRAIEGEIMQSYSSFVAQVSMEDGCVKWCLEFEKNNESAPNPDNYAKLVVQVTKGMDLYFLNH